MKTLTNTMLVLILMLLIGYKGYAQCCQPACPNVKIKYKTKVVEKQVPFVVEKEVVRVVDRPIPVPVKYTVLKKTYRRNRLSFLAGTGPTKISVGKDEVRLERGAIIGVQYQFMLNDRVPVGIQLQSNETVLGSVGIDF